MRSASMAFCVARFLTEGAVCITQGCAGRKGESAASAASPGTLSRTTPPAGPVVLLDGGSAVRNDTVGMAAAAANGLAAWVPVTVLVTVLAAGSGMSKETARPRPVTVVDMVDGVTRSAVLPTAAGGRGSSNDEVALAGATPVCIAVLAVGSGVSNDPAVEALLSALAADLALFRL